MFAMIIGIIARGMLALNASNKSKHSVTSKKARQAAVTGLEYARSQLALDSQWRGNSPLGRTIDTDSLKVDERSGNVFGRIIYPDGSQSQFRIQFNSQDGPDGLDGLDDPSSEHRISGGRLAGNNLDSGTEKLIAVMDGDVGRVPLSGEEQTVPGNSALIVVEGRAGQGIDRCQSDNLNEEPQGYVQSAVLEAVIKAKLPDESGGAAVVQAGGEINVESPGIVTIESTGEDDPGLRSKKEINVTNNGSPGTLSMPDGQVSTGSGTLNALYNSQEISVSAESNDSPFSQLAWEEVEKPASDSASVKAGTYVIWQEDTGKGTEPQLHYYDMDYDQYMDTVFAPYIYQGLPLPSHLQGEVISPNFAEALPDGVNPSGDIGIANDLVRITGDLNITPTTEAQDFAILPYGGAAMTPSDSASQTPNPTVTAVAGPKGSGGGVPAQPRTLGIQISNSKINSSGKLVLKGSGIVLEDATLISENDIYFNTGELIMKPGESNLSVYSKGNVTLSSYDKTGKQFGTFAISGTLYSWGDLSIIQGDPSLANNDWGSLEFIGSLVAYGGDPANSDPGSASHQSGRVKIVGKQVEINQDPTMMAAMADENKVSDELQLISIGTWTR